MEKDLTLYIWVRFAIAFGYCLISREKLLSHNEFDLFKSIKYQGNFCFYRPKKEVSYALIFSALCFLFVRSVDIDND
ncbi:hypothetical protein BpHYR1_007912 [Brachionus plicatilis]|uniref:Uncharacterized protein n=1 Tax=Brachionus plicatilis TaxID=10195 RepID=A0A3M7QHX9_BRAPC|nr:hypothetical protein BpHYR1_007912 [Brachionus plicatilis]